MNLSLAHLLLLRAAVVGVFGGAGLSLTAIYSRRGPLIYPVYAALLAALTVLLGHHSDISYAFRLVAGLVGFTVATFLLYVTVVVLARRGRAALVAEGRLTAVPRGPSALGHVWRWAFVLAIGSLISAAMAFVSG